MLTLGMHTQFDHPRIRYTVDFLRQHPLTQQAAVQIFLNNKPSDNEVNIYYGSHGTFQSGDWKIPAQRIFFTNETAAGPFYANAYLHASSTVYSVEAELSPSTRPFFLDQVFQFDLLETIFFHVSRYEEVFAAAQDHHDSGWLEEKQHFLVRSGLQQLPVVDQLIAAFLGILKDEIVSVPTCYNLTHDIDFLYRYPTFLSVLKSMAGTVYRRENLSYIWQHWQTFQEIRKGRQQDPYDCFAWLLSRSSGWEQKTLYLMAGGETAYDNHYRIEDPKIQEVITLAENRGYTIGLHPSYNAGFKPVLFELEKQKLEQVSGQVIAHSRQHWLRWKWSITPYIMDQLEIREDASIGYRRHLGFRAGTGFPYHLYDFRSEVPFKWWERPLVLMESAVLHEARYEGSNPISILQAFLDRNLVNTHISINFHNSNFDPTLPYGEALAAFYRDSILLLAE